MSDLSEKVGVATYRSLGGPVVVRLVGALDAAAAGRLIDEAAKIDPGVGDRVELHMQDVTFLDSAGIGALCYLEAFVKVRGGDFAISAPSPPIRAVLESAGFGPDVDPHDDARHAGPTRRWPPKPSRPYPGTGGAAMNDRPNRDRVGHQLHAVASTLTVTRTVTVDGVQLTAAGEIDQDSAAILVTQLDRALDDHDGLIVIDLGDVTFMGCAGVNALVTAYRTAPARLRLGTLHPSVRRVLEITALLDVFTLADDPSSP
jgi:anti-anti-sigma factor